MKSLYKALLPKLGLAILPIATVLLPQSALARTCVPHYVEGHVRIINSVHYTIPFTLNGAVKHLAPGRQLDIPVFALRRADCTYDARMPVVRYWRYPYRDQNHNLVTEITVSAFGGMNDYHFLEFGQGHATEVRLVD